MDKIKADYFKIIFYKEIFLKKFFFLETEVTRLTVEDLGPHIPAVH